MNLKSFLFCISLALPISSFAQISIGYAENPDKGWGDASSVVTPYVSFPEDYIKPYSGNSITAVNIAVMEEASNCYLYIKNHPDDDKYIYRQKIETLNPGWNEITLDTPFYIPSDESIAIGYKASFSKAGGVAISNEKFTDADFVYYNSKNQWTSTGGAICITAIVDGDNLPENEMMISSLKADAEAEQFTFTGYVKNMGNNDIETYSLDILLDGESVDNIIGYSLPKGERAPFSCKVYSEASGQHTVTVEISAVNGVEDSYSNNNSSSATFTVESSSVFTRRIVCEEYTGTWCGFCPRGMVGLEMMKEEHGDLFIPIAVHGGDPMEIADEAVSYNAFISSVSGAPFCKVNRQYSGDPYNDIASLYSLASKLPLHIGVDASCTWNDEKTAIEVVTTYVSDMDIDSPALNIAYTVTESGITGFPQTNYYSGGEKGELPGWTEKSNPTLDVVYNDVARAIIGSYQGMECHYQPMEAFTYYTHTQTIELPENVTDPDQIKVIPQLIDSSSGRIINAVELRPESAGIKSLHSVGSEISVSVRNGKIHVENLSGNGCNVQVFAIDGNETFSGYCDKNCTISLSKGIYVVIVNESSNVVYRKKIVL